MNGNLKLKWAVNEGEVTAAGETDTSETISETQTPTKRRSQGGRVALAPELPRVEVVHELPEEGRH